MTNIIRRFSVFTFSLVCLPASLMLNTAQAVPVGQVDAPAPGGLGFADVATGLIWARFDTKIQGQSQGYRSATIADFTTLMNDRVSIGSGKPTFVSAKNGTEFAGELGYYPNVPLTLLQGLGGAASWTQTSIANSTNPGTIPNFSRLTYSGLGLQVDSGPGSTVPVLLIYALDSSLYHSVPSDPGTLIYSHASEFDFTDPSSAASLLPSQAYDANGALVTSGYLMVKSGSLSVPEPSTCAMFILGLVLVVSRVRRGPRIA